MQPQAKRQEVDVLPDPKFTYEEVAQDLVSLTHTAITAWNPMLDGVVRIVWIWS